MQTDEVLDKLREYKAEKADVYGIETLGLFGSYARGEQKPGSDIDVCIKLKQPTFFNMTGIQEDLESIFSCKERCSICLKMSCWRCLASSGISQSL